MKFTLLFIAALFFTCSCEKDNVDSTEEKITLIKEYNLTVPEPSGLSFSANKTSYYTVSDQTGNIYKLSITGALTQTIDIDGFDLEGIAISSKNGDIYVVEERNKNVIRLNAAGIELDRKTLNLELNDDNSGLEGIAINDDNGHFYVLVEKNPGYLVELDASMNIISQNELSFASDYSGIFYDSNEKVLWIVSDESKTINKCTLDGKKTLSYSINVSKAEGIVVNSTEKEITIVLDGADKMQVYSYE